VGDGKVETRISYCCVKLKGVEKKYEGKEGDRSTKAMKEWEKKVMYGNYSPRNFNRLSLLITNKTYFSYQ
jgi:hypothetical protein